MIIAARRDVHDRAARKLQRSAGLRAQQLFLRRGQRHEGMERQRHGLALPHLIPQRRNDRGEAVPVAQAQFREGEASVGKVGIRCDGEKLADDLLRFLEASAGDEQLCGAEPARRELGGDGDAGIETCEGFVVAPERGEKIAAAIE
jgi:hypothetical protein